MQLHGGHTFWGRDHSPPRPAPADRVEARQDLAGTVDQILRPERNGHLVTLHGQEWQPAPAPWFAPHSNRGPAGIRADDRPGL